MMNVPKINRLDRQHADFWAAALGRDKAGPARGQRTRLEQLKGTAVFLLRVFTTSALIARLIG